MSPDAGMTYWLPRLVGQGRALELLYTSREVHAEEAVRIGLGNEYAEDPDARAFELANVAIEPFDAGRTVDSRLQPFAR